MPRPPEVDELEHDLEECCNQQSFYPHMMIRTAALQELLRYVRQLERQADVASV